MLRLLTFTFRANFVTRLYAYERHQYPFETA
jgi:hypothetical protein